MTTIKTPQAPSKNNSGHSGHGFITLLLIVTWIVIGAGFYGVKIGIIQSEEVADHAAKLSATEANVSALDNRLKALEKKLAEASSALNPASAAPLAPVETITAPITGTEVKPEEAKPEAAKPEETKPEEAKKPEGSTTATPPLEPLLTEPAEQKKPEEKAKPQTNNKTQGADQTALIEKKNYL